MTDFWQYTKKIKREKSEGDDVREGCWDGVLFATESEILRTTELRGACEKDIEACARFAEDLVRRPSKDLERYVKSGWANPGEKAKQVARKIEADSEHP